MSECLWEQTHTEIRFAQASVKFVTVGNSTSAERSSVRSFIFTSRFYSGQGYGGWSYVTRNTGQKNPISDGASIMGVYKTYTEYIKQLIY